VEIVLIYPPVSKPCEAPAGVARLAGALTANGVACAVIDANIDGLQYLLDRMTPPDDTWSRRAHRHLQTHLESLRDPRIYHHPDSYRRAVTDLGRLLAAAGGAGIHLGLGDYRDEQLIPVRSADLLRAARQPERNPFHTYYQERLLPRIMALQPETVGLSINYLSQALCAFALIGVLKSKWPALRIIVGGGLVTSWLQQPRATEFFAGLVDEMVAGPGEPALLKGLGRATPTSGYLPDYSDLQDARYLSPGFILPFSASDGCWWRRCAFCPERAERRPFRPLAHPIAVRQLRQLTEQTRPALIHLLDNAISPALFKALAATPPGADWYGFARFGAPLDDIDFCRRLAASGCAMLKLGLESGSQQVLDQLRKGVDLSMASRVLRNLQHVGIAVYAYLLFGTPAEDEAAAEKTLSFVVDHQHEIRFMNIALFNLPLAGPDAAGLRLHDFYDGDLAFYRDFEHPRGWHRSAVRHFLDKRFKRHPAVQAILRRDPLVFTSNHAAFFGKG